MEIRSLVEHSEELSAKYYVDSFLGVRYDVDIQTQTHTQREVKMPVPIGYVIDNATKKVVGDLCVSDAPIGQFGPTYMLKCEEDYLFPLVVNFLGQSFMLGQDQNGWVTFSEVRSSLRSGSGVGRHDGGNKYIQELSPKASWLTVDCQNAVPYFVLGRFLQSIGATAFYGDGEEMQFRYCDEWWNRPDRELPVEY